MGASYTIPYTEISISLPFGWLFEHVPGFKALRTPGRFIIITVLALAVLSGYGLVQLQARWGERKFIGLLFSVALVVFISVEYITVPIPLTACISPEVPGTYKWLAQQTDEDAVIIELPFPVTPEGNFDRVRWPYIEGVRLYYATQHWRPMVNGYSGFLPPGQDRVIADMLYFPDEASVSRLNEIGVQYVIVHTSEFDERQRSQFEEQIGHYASDLHQVAVFGDDLVFETTLQGGDATRQLLRECSFNNEIGLVGFGLNKTAVAPGDSVTLSFLWRSLDEKMTQDYTMFVHLLDEDGRLLTQHDAPPQNKPTSAWLRQEIIRAQSTITIPPGTRNGEAHLIVGVYAWPSLERLPVVCGQAMQGDTIPLTEVAIRITQ